MFTNTTFIILASLFLFGIFLLFFKFILSMDFDETIDLSLIFTLMFTLIMLGFIPFHLWSVSEYETHLSEEEVTENISSLADTMAGKSNLNGSFVLGTGNLNGSSEEELSYNVMIGNDTDGYRVKSVEASNTVLFFDEDTKPYMKTKVETTFVQYAETWLNGGLLKKAEDKKLLTTEIHELHLPKNTVKTPYNMDLQ